MFFSALEVASTSQFVEPAHLEEHNVGVLLGVVLEVLAAEAVLAEDVEEAVLAEDVEESEVGVVPNASPLPAKNSTRSSTRTSKLVKLQPNAISRKFVAILQNGTAFALKINRK